MYIKNKSYTIISLYMLKLSYNYWEVVSMNLDEIENKSC